ncbi:MAG: TSUP family transporter [Paraclostridium sordellii]
MEILYFLIAIISTIIGSAAGIGGGVIIKPALDALSKYSLPTVNLLSSSTIFIMSIVTVFYQLKKKNKINSKNTIIVAIGSIIGGVIGQKIMTLLTSSRININIINNVQSVMLIILLLIVFIYMKNKSNIKTYNINNITLIG